MANEFKIKNGLFVSGSAEITNNLTVNGRLTAEEYHVSFVSSSVLYESGSTKFGDSSDDTHLFTGSIKISGSILLNGTTVGTGKLDETTFESFTSSYLDVSSSLDGRVGDLESFSSSLDNSFVSETEFGSHTSSINGRVDDLETESGSIRGDFNLFTSSYTDVSTSIDSRLDSLETLSGSFTGSFSGSFTGDGTNLYNIPASGVTGLNLTQIADGSVTASVSNANGLRVNSKTEITGSLIVTNGITGSIDYSNITNKPTLVSGSEQVDITGTTGYSTFSSSISSSIGELSSSVATTTNDLDGRLDNVETSTGSLNSFTSSINTTIKDKLNTEGVISGSIQVSITGTTGFSEFSSSISSSVTTIFVDNFEQDGRLDAIETSTGSLNSFTSSINTTIKNKLNTEGVISGSVQVNLPDVTGYSTFSSSISSSVSSLSSSVATTTNDLDGRLDGVETSTGSLNSFTSSINTTIKNKLNTEGVISGSIQVNLPDVTGYSTFSSSVSSSIGLLSSSVATTDNTQNGRLSSLETESGSVRGDLNTYTGSNDSTNTTQNGRLTSLEGKTGSYATTGSNIFVGAQTISGSVIIRENLTVLGSSSITYTTSSQLRVDDNVIVVNTASPAERFGGLQVYDSGSVGEATGSLFWDSQKNRWVYQQSSESTYGGGVLMSGPRSSGSLGDELTLTSGKIARSAGGDHLNDSIITEYSGVTIGISGSLEITGSILSTTTPLVSGSGQISFNGITDKPTLVSGSSQISFTDITDKPTLVSGSSQVDLTATTNYSSGIKTRLNAEGVISGSSQVLNGSGTWSGSAQLPSGIISGAAQLPSGVVSGSSQVLNGSGVWSGSAQLPSGIISGAAQLPSGVVSGSSQITYSGLSGIPSGIVSGSSQVLSGTGIWSGSAQLPSGVVSGSSQVLAGTTIHSGSFFNGVTVVSGSGQISFNGITDKPTLVSGSSQITYGSLTGIPSGIVSGSSQVLAGTTIHSGSFFNGISVVSGSAQIAFGSITGVPSGLVSGSSQITYGSLSGIPSGIVSGSGQIAFGSISGVPSGLVSGSGQITLSSTSGFGSYLNQAVLTTSTPTFSTVTATTFSGALSGNATTSTNTANIGGATWAPSTNILLGQTANGQEWSFDITRNGFTGGYWHVWDSANSTMLKVDAVSGKVSAPYNFVGTLEGSITGTASNITAYTINQSVGTGNSPTFVDVYANEWFRNNNTNEGLYNQANGNHFYSTSSTDWVVTGAGGGVALQFRSNHQTTVRGYVHGDTSSNFGLLDNTGNWQVRCNPSNAGGQLYNGWTISGNFTPNSNNAYNLGSATLGWANVYTNDLHLSNMNKPEGNDIDGTSGTWTIQEGAENLYIINNRNGKKFKISLEEIL